jgi:hypothetical protein
MKFFLSTAVALTALSSLAFGQAAYTTLGSGCGRLGTPVHQVNLKPIAANFKNQTGPNEYAYPVNVSATTVTVCSGVRFFTRSLGGVKTVEARIYLPSAANPLIPDRKALEVTKMTVGPNAAYYVANFSKPHVIKGKFWVSYDNYDTYTSTTYGSTVVSASDLSSGSPITTVYWWRPGRTSWTATVSIKNPAYDIMTAGGAPALLSTTTLPTLGKLFQLDLTQSPNGVVVGIFGASSTAYGPIKLPLDLGAVAPGCFVFQSFDLLLAAGAASGSAKVSLPIPNNNALLGVKFLNQWLILNKGANALGLTFSNGGEGTIG